MAEQKQQTESQKKGFSIGLGIMDFLNPICYSINTFLIWAGVKALMNPVQKGAYLIGIIISLVLGLIIPTGKLLVGLGKIEFRLPFFMFFVVNAGIMLTGISLFSVPVSKGVLIGAIIAVLVIIFGLWGATKKFNTAIMFTGTMGYTLIYAALIIFSLAKAMILPVVLFALCWCLMIGVIVFSMKVDLTNPKNHWFIEGGNISCQIILTIGLLILF